MPSGIAAVAPASAVRPTCRPPAPKTVARGDHLRQRELEPDHEHQEDDAELGEKRRALARRQRSEATRADRESGRQIADDGRKSDSPGEAHRASGSDDDGQGLDQERTRQRPNLRRSLGSARPGHLQEAPAHGLSIPSAGLRGRRRRARMHRDPRRRIARRKRLGAYLVDRITPRLGRLPGRIVDVSPSAHGDSPTAAAAHPEPLAARACCFVS